MPIRVRAMSRHSRLQPAILALACGVSTSLAAQTGDDARDPQRARTDLEILRRGPKAGSERSFGEVMMRIARRGAASKDAIPRLTELLDHPKVGRTSAKALAWIARFLDDDRVLEAAYSKLAPLEAQQIMRHAAWWVLARLGPRAAPLLPRFEKKLLSDPKSSFGPGVFFELVRLCGHAGVPTLARMLDDPARARSAVNRLGAIRDGDLRPSHAALFTALKKPAIARAALAQLRSVELRGLPRDPETWKTAAREHLLAEDAEIRAFCAQVLGSFLDRSTRSRERLFSALAKPDDASWLNAARALARVAPVSSLVKHAQASNLDAAIRARAAVALGYVRPPATQELLTLLDDAIEGVRIASAIALQRIGQSALEGLVAKLDGDTSTRSKLASLYALGRFGSDAKAALPSAKRLTEDQDPKLAQAARRCIARIEGGAR